MTSKDYQLIADALRSALHSHTDGIPGDSATRHSARCIADALASDNPRFDRARFLAACGVPNDR